jgi:2-polyprenyl-6-methoxyphenol hydroxylase-like FAD-dependent oxidoreductase
MTKAYVIGASLAGLLAASALTGHFDQVVILERDELPERATPRRGVPQGRQLHALMTRALIAFDELLPGLTDELTDAGAAVGDLMADVQRYADGMVLPQDRVDLLTMSVSQPFLEFHVRRRVADLPGVDIRSGALVDGLRTAGTARRITGLRTFTEYGLPPVDFDSDLVVDASGRATLSPRWLGHLGYPEPAVESLQIDVTYVSRRYMRSGQDLGGRLGTIEPGRPGVLNYGGSVLAEEGDRCTLMIAGVAGAPLKSDDESLIGVAEKLSTDVLTRLLRAGTPLGPAVLTRLPAERWNRFDLMEVHPEGFLPIGDAICSFNPVYGQGITVAALQALLLRDLLDRGTNDLSKRFLTESAQIIDGQWQRATGSDRRFLDGQAPDASRAQILQDPVLAAAFLRVSQLVDPPSMLNQPDIAERIAAASSHQTTDS